MAQQDFAALDGANFQALCSLDFSALDDPEEAVVPPDVMAYLIRFFGGMPRALQYVKDRHSIAKARHRATLMSGIAKKKHRATAKAKAKAKTKQSRWMPKTTAKAKTKAKAKAKTKTKTKQTKAKAKATPKVRVQAKAKPKQNAKPKAQAKAKATAPQA